METFRNFGFGSYFGEAVSEEKPVITEDDSSCDGLIDCLKSFFGTVEQTNKTELLQEFYNDPVLAYALVFVEITVAIIVARPFITNIFGRLLGYRNENGEDRQVPKYATAENVQILADTTIAVVNGMTTLQKGLDKCKEKLNNRLDQEQKITAVTKDWMNVLEFTVNKCDRETLKAIDFNKAADTPYIISTKLSETPISYRIQNARNVPTKIPIFKNSPRPIKPTLRGGE